MPDVRTRLSSPDLADRLAALGFQPQDAAGALEAVRRVLDSEDDLGRVQRMVDGLVATVGTFARGADPFIEADEGPDGGVLPMLALIASADEVHAFHRERKVPHDISWQSLADLGQQVRVHRRTYGSFGLHTHGWLRVAWSGALYWLGRLQFNLQPADDEMNKDAGSSKDDSWVISTHIPATGPLTPEGCDDSFARAEDFFATYFADYPVVSFFCNSWLLDSQLVEDLPAGSNMVRFQQRWTPVGEPHEADGDALFFTFNRRGDVDLDTLPRDTTLQRAIIDRMQSGGHWFTRRGTVPLRAGAGAGAAVTA